MKSVLACVRAEHFRANRAWLLGAIVFAFPVPDCAPCALLAACLSRGEGARLFVFVPRKYARAHRALHARHAERDAVTCRADADRGEDTHLLVRHAGARPPAQRPGPRRPGPTDPPTRPFRGVQGPAAHHVAPIRSCSAAGARVRLRPCRSRRGRLRHRKGSRLADMV